MKNLLCTYLLMMSFGVVSAQTTLFSEDFEAGLGAWMNIDNGGVVMWGLSGDVGNETSNWTSPPGSGFSASASSDEAGAGFYDAELISPVIPVPMGASNINLDVVVNYQALGSTPTDDNFDIDVSVDGGTNWSLVNEYMNDTPVTGFRTGEGVPGTFSLDPYVSAGDNMILRFHYYNPIDGTAAFDWYAQVDDVVVTADVTTGPPIPTMGEWGIIILGLIFLNVGIIAIARRRKVLARS